MCREELKKQAENYIISIYKNNRQDIEECQIELLKRLSQTIFDYIDIVTSEYHS